MDDKQLNWMIFKQDWWNPKNKGKLSSKEFSEEENYQPKILYPGKILFKKEGEAKSCSGKQKLKSSSLTDFNERIHLKGKRNTSSV